MGKITLLLFATILFFSCTHYPAGVEETLTLAKSNRGELEKVLRQYQKDPADSLKYKAACFLIDNMKWHLSMEQTVFPDSTIYKWHIRINRLYQWVTETVKDSMLHSNHYEEKDWQFRHTARILINAIPLDTPTVKKGIFPDPQHISSTFLLSHIENAFYMWQHSSYASHLTFDQFKELILPYRAIAGYSFFENGKVLNNMFKKWLDQSTSKNIEGFILRYNYYNDFIRSIFSIEKHTQHVGIYDLFLGYKFDCVCIANNACSVFRASGIPIAVDYNISFRERTGRHFHGKFFADTLHNTFFNATYNIDSLNPLSVASPSFFRSTFGTQSDSPYMLKAQGEPLPDYFDTPCLKEVTGEYYPVTQVELPFDKNIPNHLAFLYTFNCNLKGIAPATWGKIEKEQKTVIFKNVVYNTLYFPSYLQGDSVIPFASPFYIVPEDSLPGSYRIVEITAAQPNKNLTLIRKFPEKPYLKERARHMIGGRFEGANQEDFSDSTLLYTIRESPILNLQEYTPAIQRPFRHYRYVAPDKYPHANISLIEFLTDEYIPGDSIAHATPLPIFCSEDIHNKKPEFTYMKIYPDVKKYPSQRWNTVFNTSMTYSSFSKTCKISLKRPMKVKKIRMAPANAENHIVAGDLYQLFYWDNGWKSAGTKRARYNFLQFDNVPQNRIYWLRNLTEGNEELPFFYRNGKQLFIYHDTIASPQKQSRP